MNKSHLFTILFALVIQGHALAQIDKGIYGIDNRKLFTELDPFVDTEARAINYSEAILAQIPNWRIEFSKDKESLKVATKDLQAGLKFCEGEKFLNQPIVSSCTAFLVGPDLVLTAGHCIKDKYDCKKQTWVLDYTSPMDFTSPSGATTFPKDKSYSCAELVSWSNNDRLDFALVRLDRSVEGRAPLKIRREGKTANNESLMVLGHPLGMPMMMINSIFIRDNSLTYIFKTNADTFSGNSGSPVFGLLSGLVEGILVKGDEDFVMDTDLGCNRPVQCADKECRGESVQRSTYLPFKYIPKI